MCFHGRWLCLRNSGAYDPEALGLFKPEEIIRIQLILDHVAGGRAGRGPIHLLVTGAQEVGWGVGYWLVHGLGLVLFVAGVVSPSRLALTCAGQTPRLQYTLHNNSNNNNYINKKIKEKEKNNRSHICTYISHKQTPTHSTEKPVSVCVRVHVFVHACMMCLRSCVYIWKGNPCQKNRRCLSSRWRQASKGPWDMEGGTPHNEHDLSEQEMAVLRKHPVTQREGGEA